MQLNPNVPFSTQIENLSGDNFEKVVAAALAYSGYWIDRNITFSKNKETVAEIDVVASLVTPLNEIRVALECKGANPSFNDLRKFSTVRNFLSGSSYFVDLILFGANESRQVHNDIAKLLNVKILKKEDLSKLVLPILWGTGELRNERITWLNRYLCVYTVENYYLKNVIDGVRNRDIRKLLTGYRKYLLSDLWSIKDPIEQLNNAFDMAHGEFNNFSDRVARMQGTTALQEVNNPGNEIVQAAMLLETKHRMLNIFAIARCSLLARTTQGRQTISERTPIIKEVLNQLCDYNISVAKFLEFIFRFICVWGGVFVPVENSIDAELSMIAGEMGISAVNAQTYLDLFQQIYSGGANLFMRNQNIFFLKYTPAAFRAIGKLHRDAVYQNGFNRHLLTQDAPNLALLDRVLVEINGRQNLRF